MTEQNNINMQMPTDAELEKSKKLKIERTPGYRVELCTGMSLLEVDGRLELNFFADRHRLIDEVLKQKENDPNALEATGITRVETVREVMFAASMSHNTLEAISKVLSDVVEKKRKQH